MKLVNLWNSTIVHWLATVKNHNIVMNLWKRAQKKKEHTTVVCTDVEISTTECFQQDWALQSKTEDLDQKDSMERASGQELCRYEIIERHRSLSSSIFLGSTGPKLENLGQEDSMERANGQELCRDEFIERHRSLSSSIFLGSTGPKLENLGQEDSMERAIEQELCRDEFLERHRSLSSSIFIGSTEPKLENLGQEESMERASGQELCRGEFIERHRSLSSSIFIGSPEPKLGNLGQEESMERASGQELCRGEFIERHRSLSSSIFLGSTGQKLEDLDQEGSMKNTDDGQERMYEERLKQHRKLNRNIFLSTSKSNLKVFVKEDSPKKSNVQERRSDEFIEQHQRLSRSIFLSSIESKLEAFVEEEDSPKKSDVQEHRSDECLEQHQRLSRSIFLSATESKLEAFVEEYSPKKGDVQEHKSDECLEQHQRLSRSIFLSAAESKLEAFVEEYSPKKVQERRSDECIEKHQRLSRSTVDMVNINMEDIKRHRRLDIYLCVFEIKLLPLLKDDSLKKFRLECKKAVTLPVNAISPLDGTHLRDKVGKLSRTLSGRASLFRPRAHPLGVDLCADLLARAFIAQGERTVSSKPEAAFAIAAVIVELWVDFPDFGQLLLARFHRACPYLAPGFAPWLEGGTFEQCHRRLGYRNSEEPHQLFLRRMSGVARLYAAVTVTRPRRAGPHPHGLCECWRWLAATANRVPVPDVTATLMLDVLRVAGHAMFDAYGSQFAELVRAIGDEFVPLVRRVTQDVGCGPIVRLNAFIEKFLEEGQIPPPPGRLPPDFF